MLYHLILPPFWRNTATYFCIISDNITNNATSSTIGSGTFQESWPTSYFVTLGALVELLGRTSGMNTAIENSIRHTGEDAVLDCAHDIGDPAVIASLSEINILVHALLYHSTSEKSTFTASQSILIQ